MMVLLSFPNPPSTFLGENQRDNLFVSTNELTFLRLAKEMLTFLTGNVPIRKKCQYP